MNDDDEPYDPLFTLYEYGVMPPEPTTEIAPVDPPLQATFVDVETDSDN